MRKVRNILLLIQHRIAITRNEFMAIAVCCGLLVAGDVADLVLEDRSPFEKEYALDDSVFFALSKAEIADGAVILADTTDGDSSSTRQAAADSAALTKTVPARPAVDKQGRIDLNTASAEALTRLPGIGPALAGRIVESRARLGPFRTIDEITRVSGIGKAKLARLRDHAFVSEP